MNTKECMISCIFLNTSITYLYNGYKDYNLFKKNVIKIFYLEITELNGVSNLQFLKIDKLTRASSTLLRVPRVICLRKAACMKYTAPILIKAQIGHRTKADGP